MKLVVFILLTSIGLSVHSQADYKSNFSKKWKNAKAYTLEVAEAMPADLYDYKPDPEARTFKEQLLHMISNMMWLSNSYLDGEKYDNDLKDTHLSKSEVIEMLHITFDMSQKAVDEFPEERLGEVVKFFAGPKERQQIMMLMTDHMTHHRGQILVYLKMNQIKAPRYRGW